MTWVRPATVRDAVRRRWNNGSLLTAHAAGEPFPQIRVPLAGPRAAEVADRLGEVEEWLNALRIGSRDGACYELEWKEVGGRKFQRERLPSHAVVTSYRQAWTLLGVAGEVARFETLLAAAAQAPAALEWALAHPLRALEIGEDWPRLLAALAWLDANRGSGRYLREVTSPGVDTKFAERHRGVLAAMLGVPGPAAAFLDSLGLGRKPDLVRLRPAPGLGQLGHLGLSEVAVRLDELARLDLAPERALIVENEITYLSVPVPPGGVVLWGRGFEVDRMGRLPWLASADVAYWGDLDTHGFAILDRLRSWLPGVRSVLMDRETLLEHRSGWVREERPTHAALPRLTPDEARLYHDLVEDRLGPKVRLEQELIGWPWALERLGQWGIEASA